MPVAPFSMIQGYNDAHYRIALMLSHALCSSIIQSPKLSIVVYISHNLTKQE